MSISLYSQKDNCLECTLCPNRCVLRVGKVGKCLVRKNDGHKIYLINYGEVVSLAITPIERKPFRHFLCGTKTLSIGGHGCNLNCDFCENNKISHPTQQIKSKKFSPIELVQIAIDKDCPSICMTFNEPIISYEFLMDIADSCHERGLKFLLKTNAYVNQEPWSEICKVVDAMNIDWKGSESQYKAITSAMDYVVRDRIKEAYEASVHLEISIPLYHSFLEDNRIFFQCSQFLGDLDTDIPCHLLRVHPSYKCMSDEPMGEASFRLAETIIRFYMKNVFIK